MPSSRGSSQPRDRTLIMSLIMSPPLADRFFTTGTTWEAQIHTDELIYKANRDTDEDNKGGRWREDESRDWDWHIYTTMYKTDNK